jgi:RES domain-containing protein
MRVYRLVKNKYSGAPFDPAGAKKFGGRWNSKGVGLVYAAGSESTALLEVAVHLNNSSVLNEYSMASLEIPEDIVLELDKNDLPSDWRDDPPPLSTAFVGDDWVSSGASLALAVPSTIAPSDNNYLIDVEHKEFAEVYKSLEIRGYPIDPRLGKK